MFDHILATISTGASAIAAYFAFITVRMQRELARPFFMIHDFETYRNINDLNSPADATYSVQAKIENRGSSPARNVFVYLLFYTKDLAVAGKVDPTPYAELRFGDPPTILAAQSSWKHEEEPRYVVVAISYDGTAVPWMYIRKGNSDGRFPNQNHFILRAEEYATVAARAGEDIAAAKVKVAKVR